jgi:hypothetical protein
LKAATDQRTTSEGTTAALIQGIQEKPRSDGIVGLLTNGLKSGQLITAWNPNLATKREPQLKKPLE